MKEKEGRMPLQEALSLHLRGVKVIARACPRLFPAIALSSLVKAVPPYAVIFFSARVIRELSGLRQPEELWKWVILTVAVTGLLALLGGALTHWKSAQEEIFRRRRDWIFVEKTLSMDFADADRQTTFDLRSQIRQNDNWGSWGLGQIPRFFARGMEAAMGILSALVLTAGLFLSPVPPSAGGLTLLNEPLFILLLLALLLGVSALSGMFGGKAFSYMSSVAEEVRFGNRLFAAFSKLGEDRSKAADIRMYGQQDLARHYLQRGGGDLVDAIGRVSRGPMGLYSGLSSGVSALFTGFVYLFTCLKAWAGAFGVGEVTQYVGAVTALSGNISALFELTGHLRTNGGFLKPVFQFLDIPNSMYQGSLTTEKRSDRKYDVEFRDVSFRYPGREDYALRHVSMKFRVGSRLAVVGENGSGKTTFIKLLCRLYDPAEGEILLNGIDIRKYRCDDYIRLFSVVFQDFQLLSLPLGENVAGRAEVDQERAKGCLEDAGFAERLASLPKGLDTSLYKDLDKEGVTVSGGEAQKIAIARALYKDAPFIILDEPTAALDPIAEAEIYSKFSHIAGDKTAVYISHRLSSCKFCDEIAVFDGGAIVQQGTHQALLAQEGGKYAALWQAQAQYYTE